MYEHWIGEGYCVLTHAAVVAAISSRLALVQTANTNTKRTVKPAVAPSLPPSVLIKYSATIATIGIAAPTTLMKMLLIFNNELSL